ncbi:MAG: FeoB-associated Cys-rich membrane protein [Ruminococcaceae bacterium]|nr:FeoB-associated Cys-rich membrane protein [Oscillospiraceae bacterium]
MLQFLQANWGTIVALLAVAVLVFLAIWRMAKDKKAGIGPCGQKCSQCANAGHCSSDCASCK